MGVHVLDSNIHEGILGECFVTLNNVVRIHHLQKSHFIDRKVVIRFIQLGQLKELIYVEKELIYDIYLKTHINFLESDISVAGDELGESNFRKSSFTQLFHHTIILQGSCDRILSSVSMVSVMLRSKHVDEEG